MYGERIARLETIIEHVSKTLDEMRGDLKATRHSVWAGVGVVVTVLLATLGIAIASFDSGREVAKTQQSSQPIIITIPAQQASPPTK